MPSTADSHYNARFRTASNGNFEYSFNGVNWIVFHSTNGPYSSAWLSTTPKIEKEIKEISLTKLSKLPEF